LFHVETRSFPIRNNLGDVISAVEITCDISEKVTLEEELKNRVKDLEDFYDMAVGRELKMVELKNEIRELRNKLRGYQTGE
jgi:polyhydroxyalkanoate synthesis regulator phasin